MKRIKTALSLVCALALTVTLLVVPSSASGNLFFLSVNDTLPAQSAQTTPIQHGGWVYVPVNVFSSRVTGINLGVYYGITENADSVVLYNLSGQTMTFDLANGTATTSSGEVPNPSRVVQQNGIYYVPAYAVCRYFGLTYSYYSTDYGPLLRIKDGNAVLSDALFLNSAESIMRSWSSSYAQGSSPSGGGSGSSSNGNGTTTLPGGDSGGNGSGGGSSSGGNGGTSGGAGSNSGTSAGGDSGTNDTPIAPEIPEGADPAPTFPLTLGVRASAGVDITATLNALVRGGSTAVVFFPADQVAQCADQIRQAAGRGHKVGLIPTGDTGEEKVASADAGSQALAAVLRQETWFVLGWDEALAEAGYLCWTPGLTLGQVNSATAAYQTLVEAGDGRDTTLRVLVDSQQSGGALAGVLSQLVEDGDTILSPRETRY